MNQKEPNKEIHLALRQLESQDPNKRISAIRKIGQMGPKGSVAVSNLNRLLDDSSSGLLDGRKTTVQKEAIRALANIGDIESLTQALTHKNSLVRAYSVFYLGELGERSVLSIDKIVPLLDNISMEIRWSRHSPIREGMSSNLTSEAELAADALRKIGKSAMPALLGALKNSKGAFHAAKALGRMGDRQAVPALIDALSSDNSLLRREAAQALGNLGDERAVSPLTRLLKDKDAMVRRESAIALGKLKDRRVGPELEPLLYDNDSLVRSAAASSLGEIGGPQSMKTLQAVLKDDVGFVRQRAAIALVKMGGGKDEPEVAKILFQMLKSDDLEDREEAANALARIGDHTALRPLVDCLKEIDQIFSSRIKNIHLLLAGNASPQVTKEFETRLRRDADHAKQAVVKALSVISGKNLGQRPEDWEAFLGSGKILK